MKTATLHNKKTPFWLHIIRLVVGVLFIFSGVVKANDPSGLSFKMQEFFSKWGISGLNDYTLTLAILIITFEIVAGVALLIGYRFKLFSVLLLLLMAFFLFLTGYAVWFEYQNGVPLKCGCFGDCIPLTAWQSFWKDVILLVLTVILLINRRKIHPVFGSKGGHIVMILVLLVVLLIQWLAIRNLPFVDCLPFKPGNNIRIMKEEALKRPETSINKSVYTLMIDGKEVRKTYDEYMSDSTLYQYEVVKTEDKFITIGGNPADAIVKDFSISSQKGESFTDLLLSADGYYFVWFIRDLDHFNTDNLDRIKALYQACNDDTSGMTGVIVVTSDPVQKVNQFLIEHKLETEVYISDATSIKTVVRSNPGLVLLNKGKILGKWSPANYPKGFTMEGDKIKIKK